MNQQGSAWLDGSPVAADWIDDRGLHYGDGLFETMIVRKVGIRFKAQHVARLADSCRRANRRTRYTVDAPRACRPPRAARSW